MAFFRVPLHVSFLEVYSQFECPGKSFCSGKLILSHISIVSSSEINGLLTSWHRRLSICQLTSFLLFSYVERDILAAVLLLGSHRCNGSDQMFPQLPKQTPRHRELSSFSFIQKKQQKKNREEENECCLLDEIIEMNPNCQQ